MPRTLLCWGLLFWLMPLGIYAQDLQALARLDTQQVRIGEPLTYTLEVEGKATLRVQWPQWGDSLGSFEIIEARAKDSSLRQGQLWQRQELVLMAFDSGMKRIPPQEISYLTPGQGDVRRVSTGALQVEVMTVPVDTTQTFRDIKSVQGEPFTLKEILTYVGIGLLALAPIAVLVWFLMQPKEKRTLTYRKPQPPVPPHEIAMRRLGELEGKKLWQQGQVKAYYAELTGILRSYLEARYRIPALESVTDQILRDLQGKGVPDKQQRDLQHLLPQADLAKFAKSQPSEKENLAAMEMARAFIRNTRPQPEKENEKEDSSPNPAPAEA